MADGAEAGVVADGVEVAVVAVDGEEVVVMDVVGGAAILHKRSISLHAK